MAKNYIRNYDSIEEMMSAYLSFSGESKLTEVDADLYDLDNAYVYAPVPSGNEGYMKPISGTLRKIGKQSYSFETDDMHTGGNSSSANVIIFSGYDSNNNKPKLWIRWKFEDNMEDE